ncbi:hypothetical protein Agub_g7342 [Astrephomene gubernaculifera]|uniref:GDT1 family protein n=1 Tax=Astrephomene gubernaculifera TaxID=47775 RepID=A0AAD3DRZ1_9CHLO|nr:hypothetical protein Agub_g7342 [Astrephomene gubernaculifera]
MLRGSCVGTLGRHRPNAEQRGAALCAPSPCSLVRHCQCITPFGPASQQAQQRSVFRLGNEAKRIQVQAAANASLQPDEGSKKSGNPLPWIITGLGVLAIGAYMMSAPGQALKEILVNGPLGKSGFLAAFSLILLSEIGDKTFFIAALLAMKIGKWMSFFGSVSALAVMTVISVSIGAVFSRVPDALKSSIPVGELAGIALLVFFGIKTLRDGLMAPKDGAASDAKGDELADAESAVQSVGSGVSGSKSGQRGAGSGSPLAVFLEVATLIFLAEWGDRSMLATIALGAAQSPVGVAVGAIGGHAVATGIAVVGGALASSRVSERTVNIISGALFLLFAGATAFQML